MKINCADHHLLFRAMLIPTTLLIIYYVADTVLAICILCLTSNVQNPQAGYYEPHFTNEKTKVPGS